ncbi:class I SAM-dependent methyltransferase [Marinobacter sp.]|uniref:class I SAM-dependent methyltransferase n=1 Tax=Marinobacter sp. TaxID=50741 RepID=UPI00384CC0C7
MKPISDTAFCCCGIRMDDASSSASVGQDVLAHRLMDARGLAIYQGFEQERRAAENIVARHRIIDGYLCSRLASSPGVLIVSIGSGFETRAFRLPGRWVEVDEPQVIAHKNERLPVSECPHELERIAIDFSEETLTERLSSVATDEPVIVLVEGVFLYLGSEQISDMLAQLKALFPRHTLVGDLVSAGFVRRYSQSFDDRIRQLGASYQVEDEPLRPFQQSGYRIASSTSVVAGAAGFRGSRITPWILRVLQPTLVNGYQVHVLEHT